MPIVNSDGTIVLNQLKCECGSDTFEIGWPTGKTHFNLRCRCGKVTRVAQPVGTAGKPIIPSWILDAADEIVRKQRTNEKPERGFSNAVSAVARVIEKHFAKRAGGK